MSNQEIESQIVAENKLVNDAYDKWLMGAPGDAILRGAFAAGFRAALAVLQPASDAEKAVCPICGGTKHLPPLPGTHGARCVNCCSMSTAPLSVPQVEAAYGLAREAGKVFDTFELSKLGGLYAALEAWAAATGETK